MLLSSEKGPSELIPFNPPGQTGPSGTMDNSGGRAVLNPWPHCLCWLSPMVTVVNSQCPTHCRKKTAGLQSHFLGSLDTTHSGVSGSPALGDSTQLFRWRPGPSSSCGNTSCRRPSPLFYVPPTTGRSFPSFNKAWNLKTDLKTLLTLVTPSLSISSPGGKLRKGYHDPKPHNPKSEDPHTRYLGP
jgi:hypothetical protein